MIKFKNVTIVDIVNHNETYEELISLDEGDFVLTKEERLVLAQELSTHYISYDNTLLKELTRKICRIIPVK